ncbi:FAD-dependent oxidoreductase, partial [Klebsiella pneumoniae]
MCRRCARTVPSTLSAASLVAEPTHRINVPAARMQLAGDEEGAFDHWYRHQPAFTVDVQALRPDGSIYPQRGQFGR